MGFWRFCLKRMRLCSARTLLNSVKIGVISVYYGYRDNVGRLMGICRKANETNCVG